jgi:predicted nicotinamide N-methyase
LPLLFGYEVKFQNIAVSGGVGLRIRSLLDRSQFYDPDGEAAALGICDTAWSMFGQVWPSSLILADAVQSYNLAGKRILEIGCGLAIPSMVAHRRGANVVAIDQHPLAGEFLRENLMLNALPVLPFHRGNWSVPDASLGKFDLIIASDVLYDRQQPKSLASFINDHAADAAEILVIDPNRGHQTKFASHMNAFGYAHKETRVACTWSSGESYKGRMLAYSR